MSEAKRKKMNQIKFQLEDLRAAVVDYARLLQAAGSDVEGMALEPVLHEWDECIEELTQISKP
jgi:hypothetical protein